MRCEYRMNFDASGQWIKVKSNEEEYDGYYFHRWRVGNNYYYDNPRTFTWSGTDYVVWAEYKKTDAPNAPSLIYPSDGTINMGSSVSLDWSNVDGATTYLMQLGKSNDFVSLDYNKSNLSQSNFTVSNLTPGTKYYWRAAASNSGGQSLWSSSWSFTTAEAEDNKVAVNISNDVNLQISGSVNPADANGYAGFVGAKTLFYEKGTQITITTPLRFDSEDKTYYCVGMKIDGVFYETLSKELTINSAMEIVLLYSDEYHQLNTLHLQRLAILNDFTPYTGPYKFQAELEKLFGKTKNKGYSTVLLQSKIEKMAQDFQSIADVKSGINYLQSVVLAEDVVIQGFCGYLSQNQYATYTGGLALANQSIGFLASFYNDIASCVSLKADLSKRQPSTQREIANMLNNQAISTFITTAEFFFDAIENETGQDMIGPARFLSLIKEMVDDKELRPDALVALFVDKLFKWYMANHLMYEVYIPRTQFLVTKIHDESIPNIDYDERKLASQAQSANMYVFVGDLASRTAAWQALESSLDYGSEWITLQAMASGVIATKLATTNVMLRIRVGMATVNIFSATFAVQRLLNIDRWNEYFIGSWPGMIRSGVWASFHGTEPLVPRVPPLKSIDQLSAELQANGVIDFELLDQQIQFLESTYSYTSTISDTANFITVLQSLYDNSTVYQTAINSIVKTLDRIQLADSLMESEIMALKSEAVQLIVADNTLLSNFVLYYNNPSQTSLSDANTALMKLIADTRNFKDAISLYCGDKGLAPVVFGFSTDSKYVSSIGDSVVYEVTLNVKNLADTMSQPAILAWHDSDYSISFDSVAVGSLLAGAQTSQSFNIKCHRNQIGLALQIAISWEDSLSQTNLIYVPLPLRNEYSLGVNGKSSNLSSSVSLGRSRNAFDGYDNSDVDKPPTKPGQVEHELAIYDPTLHNEFTPDDLFIKDYRSAKYLDQADAWWIKVRTDSDLELSYKFTGPEDYAVSFYSHDGRFTSFDGSPLQLPAGTETLILVSVGRGRLLPLAKGWSMVGLPKPQQASAESLMSASNSLYRMYWYNSLTQSYDIVDSRDQIKEVFWLLLKDESPHYIYLADVTIDPSPKSILLGLGANMINTPGWSNYDLTDLTVSYGGFRCSFQSAVEAGWIAPYLFNYDSQENIYTTEDQMLVGRGYWIITKQDGVAINFPAPAGIIQKGSEFGDQVLSNPVPEIDWKAVLKFESVVNKQAPKSSVTVGVKSDATNQVDNKYDYELPPDAPGAQFVAFLSQSNNRLMQEMKAPANQVSFSGMLDLNGNFEGTSILLIPKLENVQGTLTIEINGQVHDLTGDTIAILGLEPKGRYPFTIRYDNSSSGLNKDRQLDPVVSFDEDMNAVVIDDGIGVVTNVKIIDMFGKTVMTASASHNVVYLPTVSAGVYLTVVSTNNKIYTYKFIRR